MEIQEDSQLCECGGALPYASKVPYVQIGTTVDLGVERLLTRAAPAQLVVDMRSGDVLGVVNELDYLNWIRQNPDRRLSDGRVEEVLEFASYREIQGVTFDTSLKTATDIMSRAETSFASIVDGQGSVRGIIHLQHVLETILTTIHNDGEGDTAENSEIKDAVMIAEARELTKNILHSEEAGVVEPVLVATNRMTIGATIDMLVEESKTALCINDQRGNFDGCLTARELLLWAATHHTQCDTEFLDTLQHRHGLSAGISDSPLDTLTIMVALRHTHIPILEHFKAIGMLSIHKFWPAMLGQLLNDPSLPASSGIFHKFSSLLRGSSKSFSLPTILRTLTVDDAVGSSIENKGHPYTCRASSIQEKHLKKSLCSDVGASNAFHAEEDRMTRIELGLLEAGEKAEPSSSEFSTQETNMSKTRFQCTPESSKDCEDVFSTDKYESDMRTPELSTSKSRECDEIVVQKEATQETIAIESLGHRRKRLVEKAEAAAAKGDTQKSIALCDQALTLYDEISGDEQPASKETECFRKLRRAMIYLLKGQCYLHECRSTEAEDNFRRAMDETPTSEIPSEVQADVDRFFDRTCGTYIEFLMLLTRFEQAAEIFGKIRNKEARDLAGKLVWKERDTIKDKANAYFRDRDFPNAMSGYTSALRISRAMKMQGSADESLDHVLLSNRAATYMQMRDYKLALEDCNESIKLNSTYTKAWNRLLQCLNLTKSYQECKRRYEKFVLNGAATEIMKEEYQKALAELEVQRLQEEEKARKKKDLNATLESLACMMSASAS